jgi:hypothetical protein
MLYDPKWNKPSLAGLIAWLETMPPEGEYDFDACDGTCMLGQYMAHLGVDWHGNGAMPDGRATTPYVGVLWELDPTDGDCVQKIAYEEPHTFGAALARAVAYQREHAL